MDPALAYFRKVLNWTNAPLVRSLAKEREFDCESLRALFTPYVPPMKRARPPRVMVG